MIEKTSNVYMNILGIFIYTLEVFSNTSSELHIKWYFEDNFKDLLPWWYYKSDFVKYFMWHIRNGLVINLKNSLENNIC